MKKINKFLSILLATILILSAFPVTLAQATDSAITFSVETDATSAKAGDIVNVSVNMSEYSKLGALTLVVNFDNTALKVIDVQSKRALGYEEFNTAFGGNKFAYLTISADFKTVSGTLFTIQFEVLKEGCTEVSLSVEEIVDIDLKALSSETQSAKIHNYDNGTVTPPTCTEQGYTTYVCECGDSYVDNYVDALGHSFGDWTTENAPTCTETGLEKRVCSVCGETEENELSATGHDYDYENGVLIRPTETRKGCYMYICVNDTEHIIYEEVESADYTEYDKAVAKLSEYLSDSNLTPEAKEFIVAECVEIIRNNSEFYESGIKERRDLIASEQHIIDKVTNELNEHYQVVDSFIANCEAGNHDVREYVSDDNATCTVNGTKRGACYYCGTEVVADDENNPALGHDIVVDNAVAPDCVNTGLTEGSHCSRCDDATTEQIVVPALGHSYNPIVTSPTCTEGGYTTYICSACGDTYVSDETSATGHDYKSKITTAPTHTENGVMTYTCHCGDTYTETINATGDHYYVPEITSPTCTKGGYTTYTCVCGDTYVDDETPANGHDCDAVVTAPTCTETGYTTYTCTACGDTYVDDETPANGHSFSNGNCIVCGETDPDYYVFSVKSPSKTKIRNKDGIVLHTEIEGNKPAGSYVEWTSSNSNFSKTVMNDGDSLQVIANNKGNTTFTATLYDADGNVLATDTVELYSQSGLFDKIGGFFRSLFGMTTVYEN